MNLSDYEFLPGVVLTAEDPQKIGRIKASVPTWFDTEVMDEESLPWIYPFMMFGYQTFSKMEKDRPVWVFHNKNSYQEYWYVPMFHMIGQTKKKVSSYGNTEVLLSRSLGTNKGNVLVYYNDDEGLVLRVGEVGINIRKDGIIMSNSDSQMSIKDGKVSSGSSGKLQPSVLGNNLKKLLDTLSGDFTALKEESLKDPYTQVLSSQLLKTAQNINNLSQEILSETCQVSDAKYSKKSKKSKK